jgi:hypothetical protein
MEHHTTSTTENGMKVNSDFYFDQATGMMVEWRQETIQTNSNLQTNSTQMMKITSSSVWVVPEFPSSILVSAYIAIVFASALVVVGIAKFRRTRPIIFNKFIS